jgi:prepilin-type N-terminal cleavage/methylation domain-containing protein
MPTAKETHGKQSGFTLVETLMAIVILSGGLLALATAFAQGMIIMSSAHYHQVAKEKASEAIESVTTSRDTRIIVWNRIRNVSEGGVFLDGPQPLRQAGPDGLVNTADDLNVEREVLPGPDKMLDTGDDVIVELGGFTREIQISDIAPNLRQIRVIVSYRMGPLTREYQLIAYISSFA